MEEKNVHFKLDFKYKFENENYGVDEILNTGYYGSLRNSIARHYVLAGKRDQFWSLITDEEVKERRIKHYEYDSMDDATKNQILEDFYKATKDVEYDGYYNVGKYHHSVRYLFSDLQNLAASRTPEFLEAKRQFSAWLNTRPGVTRLFAEYRIKTNKERTERNKSYPPDHACHTQLIPESSEIEDIGEEMVGVRFRRFLENARPQRYKPGTVVRLRSTYLNKRGKDPFFYVYDKDLKNQERVGTVLKKINTTRNFGQGSREIRVMWFGNGEESLLMERCLEKYDPDGKPAAAKGK